ncbi:hypothetical protein SAMN05216311_120120 [Chitinophaga sp. CF418]|nr:hypothetical protein SAMN05216311_120120 [Chitinophaga sp. CF418]
MLLLLMSAKALQCLGIILIVVGFLLRDMPGNGASRSGCLLRILLIGIGIIVFLYNAHC